MLFLPDHENIFRVRYCIQHAHERSVFSLCMLEDGTLLSGGGLDRRLQAWDSLQGYSSAKIERLVSWHFSFQVKEWNVKLKVPSFILKRVLALCKSGMVTKRVFFHGTYAFGLASPESLLNQSLFRGPERNFWSKIFLLICSLQKVQVESGPLSRWIPEAQTAGSS